MEDIYKDIDKILLKKNVLSEDQVKQAKEKAKKGEISIYESIRQLDLVSEDKMASLIADELGYPFIKASDYLVSKEMLKLVPEEVCRKYRLIPLFKIGDSLTVAMANPKDIEAIDEIKIKSKCQITEPVLAAPIEINQAIDKYYKTTQEVEEVIESIPQKKEAEVEEEDLREMAQEAPIIKLVNLIIAHAVEREASDIHIEPDEKVLRVRYRIDGVLHEVNTPPRRLQRAVISRVKVLAEMDIAKRHVPQDGRINIKIKDKELDLRISTFPTVNGENVVMRILDKSSVLRGLEKLGFFKEDLNRFNELIRKPNGIILVTGPTGSGKTTTLYSALSTINSLDKNIITVEDPVEYKLPLIRQTQVNRKAGIDFANGLRSILRQDPDIIMVGEIRDKETAEMAIQASLTGHLVFSTLHTNDAPGALTRLVDMGIEPFLISNSVVGILAQRLVRLICTHCKKKTSISKKQLDKFNLDKKDTLYTGAGCKRCNNTGYSGRIGIFELLTVDDEIKELIEEKASVAKIREAAKPKGMTTLLADGLQKVKQGSTSLEEVLRVTQG
jgi:type IV pilus assembly protein PilB